MAAEDRLDVAFLAELAFAEKQSQQHYRPYIGVHKWFARRPGTLMRAILLSEFCDEPLRRSFSRSHSFDGTVVGDPFLGGGTTLTEANRIGCSIIGYDINPLASWIVREQIEQVSLAEYDSAAAQLLKYLNDRIGHLYQTSCGNCGQFADVRYFHWVRTNRCGVCSKSYGLFPSFVLAKPSLTRPGIVLCGRCETVNRRTMNQPLGRCDECCNHLRIEGNASRNRSSCPICSASNPYPAPGSSAGDTRLVAIEYDCPSCCQRSNSPTDFKQPSPLDRALLKNADQLLRSVDGRRLPESLLSEGSETSRLHRYGFRRHRDLFNSRQLVGLSLSGSWVVENTHGRVRRALLTNLADLSRYQNVLCRYDASTHKCIDAFGTHHLSVKQLWCEANLIGPRHSSAPKGTGSWLNILRKYRAAKSYCEAPYELVAIPGGGIDRLPSDEQIGLYDGRTSCLSSGSSQDACLTGHRLDVVLTDPPYHGCVPYGELSEMCGAWLSTFEPSFNRDFRSFLDRGASDLSGEGETVRAYESYARGLSRIFKKFAARLRPDGLFSFTYHHNRPIAYAAIANAIMNAGLRCTLCFPCPSEMHASIHIASRNSSRIDAVFICRTATIDGEKKPTWNPPIRATVEKHRSQLSGKGIEVSAPDLNCMRLALIACRTMAALESDWNPRRSHSKGFQQVVDRFFQTCKRSRIIAEK